MILCLKWDPKSGDWVIVNMLNAASYNNLNVFVQKLIVVNSCESIFSYVILCYKEMQHQILSAMHDDVLSGASLGWDSMYKSLGIINGRILSFLSSIRSYHDFLETNMKRIAGKDAYLELRRPFNDVFDSDKFYRIGEKYRNFVQHCGLPGENIEIGKSILEKGTRKSICTIALMIKKEKLLKGYDKWGSVCKEDIATLPNDIDVVEIMGLYLNAFITARNNFVKNFTDVHGVEFDVLERLAKNNSQIRFTESADWVGKEIGDIVPYSINLLEFSVGGYLLRNFKRHEKENMISINPAQTFFSLIPKSEEIAKKTREYL